MTATMQTPLTAKKSEKIIGHAQILDFLQTAWDRNKLAHAYLFVGPAKVGKSTVARRLAGQVLGQGNLESHPDFIFVERGSDPKTGKPHNAIVIDQVNALCGRLALGPLTAGGWKVALLDGADRLNEAAANALLKTLEEPHPRTLLLLTAAVAEAVMATIRSRCQIIRLTRVPRTEIAVGLTERGVAADRADLLARLSGGCPGLALELSRSPEILDELRQRRLELADLVEAGLTERWQGMEKLIPEKISFNEARESTEQTLNLLAELLRDAIWIGRGSADRVIHADLTERLSAWVKQLGLSRLGAALNETDVSRRRLAANVSPKTVMALVAGSLSGL